MKILETAPVATGSMLARSEPRSGRSRFRCLGEVRRQLVAHALRGCFNEVPARPRAESSLRLKATRAVCDETHVIKRGELMLS